MLAEAAFADTVDDPDTLASLYDALGGFEFGPEAEAWTVLDVAAAASAGSRGEARRLIGQGGVSVNGQRLVDPAATPPPLIVGPLLVGGPGKEAPCRGSPPGDVTTSHDR